MNRKRAFALLYFVMLLLPVQIAYADADGDGQIPPADCDDNNYYKYTGALNIPFDGTWNDCDITEGDSTLYDINDISAPSDNATYYLGETVTLIGYNFNPNFDVRILILDSENRTFVGPDPTKIEDYHTDDDVWQGWVTTNSTRGLNKTITLIDAPEHGLGIYTIYVWFTASPYPNGAPGKNEWIPIDTFTVVEAPLRLTIASPLDGETYYTGGQFTGSVNLRVSANKEIDTWWYSIDGAANKTFTPNTTINNLNLGAHTVIVYANDTEGNISEKQSSFELWYTAADKDGDRQDSSTDCDNENYYVFVGALNIPFDGSPNGCLLPGDSELYDSNDDFPPSNNATYYKGHNITLLGNTFHKNSNIIVAILDSENRTSTMSGKIWDLNVDDKIFMDYIPTDDSRNLNKTILLPDLEKHPLGIYTIYVYFTDALWSQGEWIPVDTFEVVENHAPNASIQNITGYENTNITFTLPATDSDGDPLTYSSDNPNITWNGTHLYYEADYDTVIHPELIKTITVNITADDTRLNYTQEVNVTVLDVNRLPVLASIGSKLINESELLSFNLSATDVDSDPLTFDATFFPAGAILTGNAFAWTPDYTQAGIYNVNFSVTDGMDTVNETVQITAINVVVAGDLNYNGYVDIGDVAKVAFMVAGKVPEELSADFNDNGYVDIGDAAKIAFYLAGKVGEL